MKTKNHHTLFFLLLMSVLTSTAGLAQSKEFTPEVLLSLYRLSSPQLSPSGKHFLYSRSLPDIVQNSISTETCIGNTDDKKDARVLLPADWKASSARFLDDEHVTYLSQGNLWIVDLGGNRQQISHVDFKISDYLFSPDRKKVVLIRELPIQNPVQRDYADLPKATGKIYDDLMYKHWDEWVETIPQPYLCEVKSGHLVSGEAIAILSQDEKYEVPQRPFGGMEQLSWSPDSKYLAYSCRKKVGLAYAVSTNTDIYLYDTEARITRNITEGMMGYDTTPAFSPDGRYIAWASMERDGYEADLNRLFLMDLSTGKKTFLSEGFERNIDQLEWADDSQSIVFQTNDLGLNNLFRIRLSNRKITPITRYEDADVSGFALRGNLLMYGLQSMKSPKDIYQLRLTKGDTWKSTLKRSSENDPKLAGIPNITVEKRWITTTDNKKMLTWVILPPHFDPQKKYPAILYCQGGPQSTVSQFWSYRWNLRTFASHGYIIVAPNRRGVPGFGKEWNEQISGDYGGQNMKDYLSAIDDLSKEPYVDRQRLGATGASYGGFSVYWLAGHHEKRFKAFFAHAGIFNLESQYLETEEKFFANWDMGGPYWEKDNAVAQKTFANSPHRFVDRWDTPIFICHGEYDYRILASQGMMAFDAARMRGIPTRMLIYPDESHWILQPQNGLLFYRSFFEWMDKWLKR